MKVIGRLIVPKDLEDRVNSLELYKQNQANTIAGKESEISTLQAKNTELKNVKAMKEKDLEGFNVSLETLKMEEFGIKKECEKIRNDIKNAKDEIGGADKKVQSMIYILHSILRATTLINSVKIYFSWQCNNITLLLYIIIMPLLYGV